MERPTVRLIDTGGLEVDTDDPVELRVQEQARLAIAEADVIVFMVDAAAGMTPADLEAADLLRRATAPVIVAVNKADNEKRELEAAEFHALGWEETYPSRPRTEEGPATCSTPSCGRCHRRAMRRSRARA